MDIGELQYHVHLLGQEFHNHQSWQSDSVYSKIDDGRSQIPRGLRHEMPLPAPILRSWVRISLQAWMFVCVYSVFEDQWKKEFKYG
jgi:hypothetical protein